MKLPRIPFAHAHDQERAGLRDYRAELEPETPQRWPRWIAGCVVIALLVGLAFVLLGCAWYYPPRAERNHLDAPHPNPERIGELADLKSNSKAALKITDAPWLRLSSPFVLAGGSVRLTCFFPATADHRYLRLALVDGLSPIRVTTHAETYDELLIERIVCGSYAASCDSLATSNRVLVHLEQSFTSRGSCNAAGEDR